MVKFRCKASGNIVSFSSESDIECMRKESGYEEVKDGMQEQKASKTPAPEVKKRGRPAKTEYVI